MIISFKDKPCLVLKELYSAIKGTPVYRVIYLNQILYIDLSTYSGEFQAFNSICIDMEDGAHIFCSRGYEMSKVY